jgi:hypothetical protein
MAVTVETLLLLNQLAAKYGGIPSGKSKQLFFNYLFSIYLPNVNDCAHAQIICPVNAIHQRSGFTLKHLITAPKPLRKTPIEHVIFNP